MDLHRPSGNRSLGFSLAAITMVSWGVLPLALKVVLDSLDAVTITWFRFGVSCLLLGGWLAWRGGLPRLGQLPGSARGLLVIATAGLAVNYLSYLVGLDFTSPANAQVLIQMAPLLLAIGGLVVFKEHFTRLQWFGFSILVGGLCLFFASQLRVLAQDLDRYLSGVGVLVLAAVTWAIYGLAQKQLLQSLSSQAVMLCLYVGCFLFFSLGAKPAAIGGMDGAAFAALIFCAVNTLVAYGAFAAALEHWEASRVSAVISLTPLATLAFAQLGSLVLPSWVHPEVVSPASLLGAFAVVGGSLVISLAGRPRVTAEG